MYKGGLLKVSVIPPLNYLIVIDDVTKNLAQETNGSMHACSHVLFNQ